MKENFGMNYHVHFHFSADGRRDRHCFRHVVSEAETGCIFTEFTNTESFVIQKGYIVYEDV